MYALKNFESRLRSAQKSSQWRGVFGRGIFVLALASVAFAIYRFAPKIIRGSRAGAIIMPMVMNRTKAGGPESMLYFDGVRHRVALRDNDAGMRGADDGSALAAADDEYYDAYGGDAYGDDDYADDDAYYGEEEGDELDQGDDDALAGSRRRRQQQSRRRGGSLRRLPSRLRGRGKAPARKPTASSKKQPKQPARKPARKPTTSTKGKGATAVDAEDGHTHDHSHEEAAAATTPGAEKQQELPAAKPVTPKRERKVVTPPREAGWVPEERPLAGDAGVKERSVTSHRFQEATEHSMNPPFYLNPAFAGKPGPALAKEWPAVASKAPEGLTLSPDSAPDVLAELDSRLVIGVGMGVHSGHTDVGGKGLVSLPLFNTLLPTFLPTAQPHHIYRFYFAFDHNDPVYESAAWRAKIEAEATRMFAEENAKRWHPEGYVAGETVDGSTLLVSIHWVHCNYAGKPAWAHSDAVMAAFREGADYVIRMNDDTAFPTVKDWADRMVSDLRGRKPIPNLGVVGPACSAGANWILTHDFTHRTHAAVFGVHYPRSLPDWSSDDWVTYVYKNFGLMSRREDAPVEHRLHGQRYKNQAQAERLQNLNAELARGAEMINEWAQANHGVTLPFTLQQITCC